MKYSEIYKIIALNEGGYVNDPDDSGGETYAGISRKHHPEWIGWHSLDKISDKKFNEKYSHLNSVVAIFYQKNYWNKINGNKLNKINSFLALHVFDMAVNAGISRASKMLQKMIGAKEDGVIGSKTLKKLIEHNCYRSEILEDLYISLRKNYYHSIAKGKNIKFLNGWIKRVDLTTQRFYNN